MSIHTKWPRLVVAGAPVSPEQAADILIRTNVWDWIGTNDGEWDRMVTHSAYNILGRPYEPNPRALPTHGEYVAAIHTNIREMDEWCTKWGILKLSYLHNWRIASSWIGGPHGWCNWDGTIGCSSWNIGKWPTDREVTEDWEVIARAFPYLDLIAQVIDDEGEGTLAAEWQVKDGTVVYNPDPTTPLVTELEEPQYFAVLSPYGERGCSLDQLRAALKQLAEKDNG